MINFSVTFGGVNSGKMFFDMDRTLVMRTTIGGSIVIPVKMADLEVSDECGLLQCVDPRILAGMDVYPLLHWQPYN